NAPGVPELEPGARRNQRCEDREPGTRTQQCRSTQGSHAIAQTREHNCDSCIGDLTSRPYYRTGLEAEALRQQPVRDIRALLDQRRSSEQTEQERCRGRLVRSNSEQPGSGCRDGEQASGTVDGGNLADGLGVEIPLGDEKLTQPKCAEGRRR